VSDIAGSIPVLGVFLKAAMSIVTLGADWRPPASESASQECQQLFANLPPQKSGSMLSGDSTAPADYFANVNPLARFWLGPSASSSEINALQRDIDARSTSFWVDTGAFAGSSFDDMIRHLMTSKLVDSSLPPTLPFYIAGPMKCRSAIGMALMQVTEGMAADIDDFDWEKVLKACCEIEDGAHQGKGSGKRRFKDAKTVRWMWERSIERDAQVMVLSWRKTHPKDVHIGLPKAWRERFRTLRRGIEASYFANSNTTTDGGAALWTTYIDLVAQAYTAGYLNDEFVTWIFERQMGSLPAYMPSGSYAMSNPGGFRHDIVFINHWQMLNERLLQAIPEKAYVDGGWTAAPMTWIWFREPCPKSTAYQIGQLARSWSNTTRPHYTLGKEKLADLMKQVNATAIARGRAIHASGPGALRPKRVGDSHVASGSQPADSDEGASDTSSAPTSGVGGALDDAEAWVCSVFARASTTSASTSAPEPATHAAVDLTNHTLHFANNFDDAAMFGIRFAGLCGGMAYTVLDSFFTKTPLSPRTTVPSAVTDPLGRYIYDRQVDTLLGWHAVQFLALLVNPDDHALTRTSSEAFDELRRSVDQGKPVVLGLIPAPYTLDVTKFTRAHQVVARGYRVDPDGGRAVLVWDPNRPNETDTRLTQAPGQLGWAEVPGGGEWRGLFVESGYTPKVPPSVLTATQSSSTVAGTSDVLAKRGEDAPRKTVAVDGKFVMIPWGMSGSGSGSE
jgi:hypothetical protein